MKSQALQFTRMALAALAALATSALWASAQTADSTRYEVTQTHEQVELIQNSSRRLRFAFNIPEFVLENPLIVQAQPVAPNEIVLRGIKPGVTSITVSDADRNLTTIDIHVVGDVRKLQAALIQAFPDSNIKPIALQTGVMLQGTVARSNDIPAIMNMARNYYPEAVINRLDVGGSQLVAMQVRVYEVSRSKLRQLGVDWAFSGQDFNFVSSVADLIRSASAAPGSLPSASGQNITFGVFSDNSQIAWFVQALERNDLAKLLDEPTLVAMNGRAAEFLSGGEIPIQVASGLGTNSIEFRPFGTKLDLVPIVLGEGRLRLEIRAEVSEVAADLSGNTGVPGFRVRRVNTGVEMNAGHTLALAGDYREETEATKQGLPWLVNRPYLGQLFRRVEETKNEIELVFLVTPQFIADVEASQLPVNIPGRTSQSPSDCEFYLRGYTEVPQCETECPLPVPVGAVNAVHNVLPVQPYVPQSLPGAASSPETSATENPPVIEAKPSQGLLRGLRTPLFQRSAQKTTVERR